MESYAAFEQAVMSTAGIVKLVRQDQMTAPTPCSEWDVRALLNHVIGTLWLGQALLGDSEPRYAMAPGGLPDTDLAGTDPAAAYSVASGAALAAASDGDALTRLHVTPLGEMPGPILAGFTTLDIFVHGWDLAKAIGQPVVLDDAVADHVLGFAQQALGSEEMRAGRIGLALAVPETASVGDRLAGFLGRQP
ncbi:MAG TPA: TIGR03086 family metal-binding protein [Streptosporangiaceae bacterium]|jgi:uncharacterized protein (TIGR03086 family)